jgi:predicted Zn finger-like uncharacterized protein
MLIVCPSCATSYDVELASLRPNGRQVRCVRCHTVWHAALSQTDIIAAAAEAIAAAPACPAIEAPEEAATAQRDAQSPSSSAPFESVDRLSSDLPAGEAGLALAADEPALETPPQTPDDSGERDSSAGDIWSPPHASDISAIELWCEPPGEILNAPAVELSLEMSADKLDAPFQELFFDTPQARWDAPEKDKSFEGAAAEPDAAADALFFQAIEDSFEPATESADEPAREGAPVSPDDLFESEQPIIFAMDSEATGDAEDILESEAAEDGEAEDAEDGEADAEAEDADDFAEPESVESFAARHYAHVAKRVRRTWPPPRPQWPRWPLSQVQSLILILFIADSVLVGWRTDMVRLLPQTASFYSLLGLGVNVRGVDLDNVTLTTEQHDGVASVVVEGNIVNDARRIVHVPRLKFAVRDDAKQEIYSWTAMPPRSTLMPGQVVAFHTRVAAVPADGHDLLVRFVSRRDIVTSMR